MRAELVIAAALIGMIGLIIFAAYSDSKRPGFELKKADWQCSKSHTIYSGYFIQSGQSQIWIPTATEECDQWTRKN